MTMLPAYAIHGGQATGEMLRLVSHATSSGARGIARPHDFRVTPRGGGEVNIAPGGALLPTRYVSSPMFQTYAVGMTHQVNIPIPPTGSGSGAVRYVIARIEDPQYGGQDMGSPNWRFDVVGSISNLPYPFVELAKITMPPSTSTITGAMIEDIRNVALPRNERHVVFVQNVGTDYVQTSEFESFTTGYERFTVPDWANRVIIRADVLGVVNQQANVDGQLAVRFGNINVGVRRFDYNWDGQTERHDLTIAGEADISMRGGVEHVLKVVGRRMGGSGRLYADNQSAVIFEFDFIEAPA